MKRFSNPQRKDKPSHQMNPSVEINELEIVLALKNNLPPSLIPNFLLANGIIPPDWQLASQPISTSALLQVMFTNGISLIAQGQRMIFIEGLEGKSAQQAIIPKIAQKYVKSLPNLDYQAVGINPKGYVTFDSKSDAAREYIAQTLLSSGSWQEFGKSRVKTSLKFSYTLENGFLNLIVNEAALRRPDETIVPIVLFNGNFEYDISSDENHLRLQCLVQFLDDWQHLLEIYQDLVNTRFLTKTNRAKNLKTDYLLSNSLSARD